MVISERRCGFKSLGNLNIEKEILAQKGRHQKNEGKLGE